MRIPRRKFSAIFAALALAAAAAITLGAQNSQSPAATPAQPPPQAPINASQQPPPPIVRSLAQSKNVIRATVDLVQIDVQVVDRDGKPVKGLTQAQFHVSEDGKQQKVSTFEYFDVERIETAAAADQSPITIALGAIAPPAQLQQQVKDRRLTVLFFDMSSLEPDQLLRPIAASDKFVRTQMSPADLVGIVVFGNQLEVIADLTNDKSFLERALAALKPGAESQLAAFADAAAQPTDFTSTEDTDAAFTADNTEFNIFNTDRKLAAIEAVADILADIPGRKSVVHFTGGITQTGEENRSQLRAATDAANRSNVSIYTVDARGLLAEIPGGDATSGAASGTSMFTGNAVYTQTQSREDSRETLATLASDTGGRSFFDLGDFGEAFKSVQDDGTGYYLVGYYSTDGVRDGRWRNVKVSVENLPAGAHIHYREGYYAPKDFGVYTTEDRERQLEEAMSSETPEVELPVAVETAAFRLNDTQYFVPIAAKLASSALQWAQKSGRRQTAFDFAAEIRVVNTTRAVAALRDTITVQLDTARFAQVQQQALLYQGGFVLAPGNYTLKFLARENESGRIGTFEENISLPAPQPDKLQLSSVLLSSQLETVQKTSEVKTQALAADAHLQSSPLDVEGQRIVPSVTRVFTGDQSMYVFFQAYPPAKSDPNSLRAGLVLFRNGARVNQTPMVEPSEIDSKTGAASFRISLPLGSIAAGRYTLQAVAVEPGTQQAAFARNYFALRPAAPAVAPTSTPAATPAPSPSSPPAGTPPPSAPPAR
ncbi:MAG: VWA domain-containing protein [Candidatus Acidiferrales bacterium]|jgi:VWFA-related protein